MKKNLFLLSAAVFCSIALMAQTVSKFNGIFKSGGWQFIQSSQTFANASYYGPQNIIFDKNGNGWVLEGMGSRLRIIDAGQTAVYLRAGNVSGTSGSLNNTAGSNALFQNPTDFVMDTSGNFYIADAGNNCIRKVSPYFTLGNVQSVTTFAGVMGATGGYLDATGTSAQFNAPTGLAIDNAGNIYVSDYNNHCIRKITPSGVVSLLAGSGTGNPLAHGSIDSVGGYASFYNPSGLGWFSTTELLVADLGNAKIRKVNILTGRVTTIAGTGTPGNTDGDALTQAKFSSPTDVVMDGNQNIYVTDGYSNLIRKISGSCVTTFAGSEINAGNAPATDTANGIGTNARFNVPTGISFYNGVLYVSDYGNNSIRKITVPSLPQSSPIAKFSINASGSTNTAYNFIDSTVATVNSRVWRFTPNTVTYVGGTDSTSAIAQVKFNVKANYTVTLTDVNCWGKNTKSATINILNTGVNEVNADKYISVYPNPTNGLFEIDINTIEANTLRLMDINGKVIIERKVLSSKERLDMTGFAKGVYILNISGSEFSLNKKLILE